MDNQLSIRSILRADSQTWWWHIALRRQGNIKEADRLERESMRRKAQDLLNCRKNGGWLFIRPDGSHTLYISDTQSVMGDRFHTSAPLLAQRVGITVVDFRGCDENIIFCVWMWEPNPWRPDPPLREAMGASIWSKHQRCPLWWYLDRCADVGATIHNYPEPRR